MECEKLAQEKTEMQRHYVMYYEMSYGLNVEMHKQVRDRNKATTHILTTMNPPRNEYVFHHVLSHLISYPIPHHHSPYSIPVIYSSVVDRTLD